MIFYLTMENSKCAICLDNIFEFNKFGAVKYKKYTLCNQCQSLYHKECAEKIEACPYCRKEGWRIETNSNRDILQGLIKYEQNKFVIDNNVSNIDKINKSINEGIIEQKNKYDTKNAECRKKINEYDKKINETKVTMKVCVIIFIIYFASFGLWYSVLTEKHHDYQIREQKLEVLETEVAQKICKLNKQRNDMIDWQNKLKEEAYNFQKKIETYKDYDWLNLGNRISEYLSDL